MYICFLRFSHMLLTQCETVSQQSNMSIMQILMCNVWPGLQSLIRIEKYDRDANSFSFCCWSVAVSVELLRLVKLVEFWICVKDKKFNIKQSKFFIVSQRLLLMFKFSAIYLSTSSTSLAWSAASQGSTIDVMSCIGNHLF